MATFRKTDGGGGRITGDEPLILIACSGVSNVGKLTAQAANVLMQREPDLFEGYLHAKQSTRDMGAIINGGRLVVLDGCRDRCAAKKLKSLRLNPCIHIVATEEGIEKNGMADPKFEEIEMLIAAVRRAVRG
ncbi:MAG: putative zinc-binding protein [Methanomicrobiales archaeon]|nr:putative zinc-binding protein [Methanomicrobiales archaeon]